MKRTPVALALVALCGIASADPSPEIKYLMHEPATMLDVGLDRLRGSLQTILDFNLHDLGLKILPSVIPIYDFDRNQIDVLISISEPDFPAPKETCRQVVKGVQKWMSATTVWTAGFMHSGYTLHSQADEAVKAKLPSLIEITATVSSEKRGVSGFVVCSATLTTGVTFDGA